MECFQNRKMDQEKLLAYGFYQKKGGYVYDTSILDQFDMSVSIDEIGTISTKLWDRDAKEEYVLHRTMTASGTYVFKVRAAHDAVLQDIVDKCFVMDVFHHAADIMAYVKDTYGDDPEYLWKKFPNNAIWRRKDTGKWYGALLTVSKSKLGLASDEMVEILDLRGKPEEIQELIDGQCYYAGYHMNKKHWYTMLLDNSVPYDEICQRIDESYLLATK